MMPSFAIIFDMDGVLVDSMPFHAKAWKEFLKQHAVLIEETDLRKLYGRTNKEILREYFKNIPEQTIMEYAEEKEKLYRKIFKKEIKIPNGLRAFLELLKKEKIPRAIGTAAPPENVYFVLAALNIKKYFSVIVDDTQVSRGKPDPQVYVKAAECLHYDPKNCIVIEDAPLGILAGKNAGMRVIAITTAHAKKELLNADLVIDSFGELSREKLVALMKR